MKRITGFIILFSILFGGISVSAESNVKNEFDYSNPEFQATVDMLSMEGHGNDDVASCSVKQLYYQEVAEMFEKGMTKQEILDYYVEELGVQALKAPPKKGFNLTLWVTPFLLIFLVLILIFILIKKWKKLTPALQTGTEQPVTDIETEIYHSIIEEERKQIL
ncbi:cytochrome c-type biogenesis protein CcmH [Neobacillus sp. LXY-4]|uniref:cytochrome c-type biogenesis protein CcmH n=1 Tax=Neobacillus sp. LXY-4 TaxID=3379826 RepID=UPI003EE296F1